MTDLTRAANDNNTDGNNPSAGIYLNSSCPASAPGGCLIEDNTALRNAFHDINIRDDSRAFGPPFEIIIRNNDVTAASEVDGCSFAGVTCSGNA